MWKRLVGSFRDKRLTVDVAALSERGLVRPDNQDHVLVHRAHLTYGIADGMGSGDGGAKASEIVCRAVEAALVACVGFPERVKRVHEALQTANTEIRAFAEKAGFTRQMASTAAILVLDCDHGDQAAVGFVGDSRVYRFRDGALQQLSRDHTVAREIRSSADGPAVAAEQTDRHHAFSHVLTRAVGAQAKVTPEWRQIDLRQDDAFLICSDGVSDMVSDEEIQASFAAGGKAWDTAACLAKKVMAGGAVDNYSMVVVKIGGFR